MFCIMQSEDENSPIDSDADEENLDWKEDEDYDSWT